MELLNWGWWKCDDNAGRHQLRGGWWGSQRRNNEMFFECPHYFSGNPSHEENATETRRTSQVVHRTIWGLSTNRANQLTADEQTQNGEMMFYTGTLLPPLWKKLLKKMHSNYGPRSLREAFEITLEFEKEYQITQPQSTFNIMDNAFWRNPRTGGIFNGRSPDEIADVRSRSKSISTR